MRQSNIYHLIVIVLFSLPVFSRAEVGKEGAPWMTQDILKVRDPFKAPPISAVEKEARSELELFSINQLKLAGVMTGPNKTKGMILAPNGKTYFVTVNDRIGNREGVVERILSDAIVVREKVMNVLGEEEEIESVLRIQSEP